MPWFRGTQCDCKPDWLWIQFPLDEMKYLFKCIFPFLGSGVQAKSGVELRHSIPLKFGGKWGMKYLNTRFLPMPCDPGL